MTKRENLSAAERKAAPIARGALDYFPDALLEVARLSLAANEQHNPGEPMHWAKEKSTDEADALLRHLIDRGTIDVDGQRHSAKVAWRALALLQRELEAEAALDAAGVPKDYIHIEQDVPAWTQVNWDDGAGSDPHEPSAQDQIEIRRTSEDKPVYVKGHWEGKTWVKGGWEEPPVTSEDQGRKKPRVI